jgi:hypothetical protein
MPTEIVVSLENRPGTLARLGRALGDAGVNIEGIASFGLDGEFIARVIPSDPAKALETLRAGGFIVKQTNEMLEATLEDRPGALGRFCEKLGAAGINIDALYAVGQTAEGVRIVVTVDDFDRAKGLV